MGRESRWGKGRKLEGRARGFMMAGFMSEKRSEQKGKGNIDVRSEKRACQPSFPPQKRH